MLPEVFGLINDRAKKASADAEAQARLWYSLGLTGFIGFVGFTGRIGFTVQGVCS